MHRRDETFAARRIRVIASSSYRNELSNGTNLSSHCQSEECKDSRLLLRAQQRRSAQFVTKSSVKVQPHLSEGLTTVFEIDGRAARLADLDEEDSSAADGGVSQTVFRIVPKTHAHIINYIVVDDADEALRKVDECDSEMMRKLLDAQKVSAEQMLKRLILGQTGPVITSTRFSSDGATSICGSSNRDSDNDNSDESVISAAAAPPIVVASGSGGSNGSMLRSTLLTLPTTSTIATRKRSIALPIARSQVRPHPNLRIAAVTGGVDKLLAPLHAATLTPTGAAARSQLRDLGAIASTSRMPPSSIAATSTVVRNRSTFDQIQNELNQLRHTVMMLAGAQANSGIQQNEESVRSTQLPTQTPAQCSPHPRSLHKLHMHMKLSPQQRRQLQSMAVTKRRPRPKHTQQS